jgi:hypothetical protein
MTTRFIIIDDTRGVFLGSYSTSIFEETQTELAEDIYDVVGDNKLYALFAYNNPFEVACAPTFICKREANAYIKDYLTSELFINIRAEPVLTYTEDGWASLAEMIKSGYEKHTHEMLKTLSTKSSLIH